jgi:hypothetical protein
VEGAASFATTIYNGWLNVGSNETASSFTITATSVADTSKFGTASVSVKIPVSDVYVRGPSEMGRYAMKGGAYQLSATVQDTSYHDHPNQTVTWSLSGGSASSIDQSGLLTVGDDENATELTVTATSAADPTKSDSETFTVPAGGIVSFSYIISPSAATVFDWQNLYLFPASMDIGLNSYYAFSNCYNACYDVGNGNGGYGPYTKITGFIDYNVTPVPPDGEYTAIVANSDLAKGTLFYTGKVTLSKGCGSFDAAYLSKR